MKISELQKVMKRAEHAQEFLNYLDRAQGIEIDLLKANGKHIYYGDNVKVLDDAAFIEGTKSYLRDRLTKILNEALAQLAAHGLELDDPEPEEEEELEDAA